MMSCAVVRAAARDEQKCPKHVEANHSTPGEGTHSPESSLSLSLSLERSLPLSHSRQTKNPFRSTGRKNAVLCFVGAVCRLSVPGSLNSLVAAEEEGTNGANK